MRIEMSHPEGSQQPESKERERERKQSEQELMMMTGEESRAGEITAGLG